MTMNLYDMGKTTLIAIFTVFLCLFGISVIIGAAGPPIFDSYQTTALSQGVDMRFNTSVFNWEIQHLDKLNQMLFFRVAVVNGRAAYEGISTKLVVKTSLYGSSDGRSFEPIISGKTEARSVKCSQGNVHCDEVTLLHEPFVEFPVYRVEVSFVNAENEDWIRDAVFIWRTFNHSYTLFELWFRFVFLVITFGVLIWFSHRMRKFSWSEWAIEQKWSLVLLFGLMGYNNPFFALNILMDSWFPAFLDVSLFVLFLSLVLVFWLCVFDAIRKPAHTRTFLKFYAPKVGLVGILAISSLVVFLWQELHDLDDPTYDAPNDIPGFIFFRVVQILLLIAYLFWFVVIVIFGVKDRRSFPLLGVRIKYLGVMTFFVIAITIAGVVLGVLGTIQNNAAQFLSFFSLFNLYVYFLAIVYAPTKDAGGPAHVRLTNMAEMAPSDSDSDDLAAAGVSSSRRRGGFRDSYTDEEEDSRGSAVSDLGRDSDEAESHAMKPAAPSYSSDGGDDGAGGGAAAAAPPVFGAQPLQISVQPKEPQPDLL